jgi:hypothetical protein
MPLLYGRLTCVHLVVWVLTTASNQSVRRLSSICFACLAGLRALASLPAFSTEHVLKHRPGWGELYDILGVEPANLAQLLQVRHAWLAW